MINSVQDYHISHYFNPDGAQSFFIPKYQREFVWGKDNWEALLNDVEDSPPGHFLGSIICINNQKDAMAGGRLELIDGQQRFTTITLLFCALFQKLASLPEEDKDDDLKVELANLKRRLFIKSTGRWRFEPSEQAQNKADLQYILHQIFPKEVSAPKGLSYFGNRRIARAYYYFTDKLKPATSDEAKKLLEKLKMAILIKIEVPSHSDAFILFETINNRGIPLSAIDIIKNNLLAELDKKPNYGIDRAFDEWKELVDLLPDSTIQERFLRQLYNGFRYLKSVQLRSCPRATRTNLITIYDTLLRKRPVWLFKKLQIQGKVYSQLINPAEAKTAWNDSTAAALQDLQRLGAAPAYTFLIWANQVAISQKWDEKDLIGPVATILSKWFFWRNLTDTPPTRELDLMFMGLISDLLKQIKIAKIFDPKTFVSASREWLLTRMATASACDEALNGGLYVENYDITRFLLSKLEEAHQTVETKRDLWARDASDRPIFTVEHILPKTENLSAEWTKMLEDGVSDKADAIRVRCAHQLGNLTLSGYNAKLGTMDFLRKRDRQNETKDYIGYKNNLYLNSELAALDKWNEAAIIARTDKMIAEVKALFAL